MLFWGLEHFKDAVVILLVVLLVAKQIIFLNVFLYFIQNLLFLTIGLLDSEL